MVVDLEKEKAEEIKHRDYCIENFNENERDIVEKSHIKGRLEQKKEGLESEIKSFGDSIFDLESQIVEMNTQLKRAKEDREAEHEVYLGTLKD